MMKLVLLAGVFICVSARLRKPLKLPADCGTTCPKICPYGFQRDVRGCAMCKCANPPFNPACPIPMCMDECEEYVYNKRGCQTCRCRS